MENEVIQQVPLDLILVDRSWNSRRSIGDDSEGSPEDHGFSDLVESMRNHGQDTPVTVRPYDGGNGSHPDKRYQLVAGFRRFFALERLAKEEWPGNEELKPSHIKVILRRMGDVEARILNGRENLARKNLNPADTAYTIHLISKLQRMTDSDIAKLIGLSQVRTSSLHRLYKGLSEIKYQTKEGKEITAFEHWREAPGRIAEVLLRDLVNSRVDARLKDLKYLELLNGPVAPEAVIKTGSRSDGVVAFAAMLGKLEKAGLIQVIHHDWIKLLDIGKHFNWYPEMPESQIEEVCARAREAFERGSK